MVKATFSCTLRRVRSCAVRPLWEFKRGASGLRMQICACSPLTLKRGLVALPVLLFAAFALYSSCFRVWTSRDMAWRANVSLGEPRSNGKIAILSCLTGDGLGSGNEDVEDWLLDNKRRYAVKHGYDFVLVDTPYTERWSEAWQKIPALLTHLFPTQQPGYKWIWALDFDTVITNSSIALTHSILPAEGTDVHVVATRDCNGLNAGSMFFRQSPLVRDLLFEAWGRYWMWHPQIREFAEQGAMATVLQTSLYNDSVRWMPLEAFNSYFRTECGHNWKPGEFVKHFPSRVGKSELIQEVRQYRAFPGQSPYV